MNMHLKQVLVFTALIALLKVLPANAGERDAWFRDLDLAERVASAPLIMSVEVERVEEAMVIAGGKGELSITQIRFRPLTVFKGVYTRSELLLTDQDIGGYRQPHLVKNLRPGEGRLLLLDRHSQGYGLAGYANDFDHAVPPLRGSDDPLLPAVRTLIEAQRKDKRIDQTRLLLEALGRVNGAGAVVLLRAIRADAVLIAQMTGGIDLVARHLKDPAPAVRAEAAATMQAVLDEDYIGQSLLHERAAGFLLDALSHDEKNLVTARALFHALSAARLSSGSARLQQSVAKTSTGDSLAVNAAELRAAGQLRIDLVARELATRLADAPVDAPDFVISDIALGAIAFDPPSAARALHARIERKIAAGLTVDREIVLVAELPKAEAVKLLQELGAEPLALSEQAAFTGVAAAHPDQSLVVTLKRWVGGYDPELRTRVLNALRKIDTPEAASAARPELGPEPDLAEKLRLAAFLGRHGYRDGYPFAVEHMSEEHLRDDAVTALVAMRDSRTVEEMRRILETSNDDAWNAPAVLVLGGLGEQQLRERFYGYARGPAGKLAAAAMVALAEIGDVRVLDIVRQWLDQRETEMHVAAARSASIALVRHRMQADDVAEKLARILSVGRDRIVSRRAFETLAALDDRRLNEAAASALRNSRQDDDFQELIIERLRSEQIRAIGAAESSG